MARYLGHIAAIVFNVACASAQEEPLPEVWQVIEAEARSALRNRKFRRSEETINAWLEATARRISADHDRSTSDRILRTFDRIEEPMSHYLAVSVVLHLADPHDQHGLKSVRARWGHRWRVRNWHCFATAAIDTYHDSRSRDFLLECLRQDTAQDVGTTAREIWSPFECAAGLLRSYAPADTRPKLERCLSSAKKIAETAPGSPLARRQNQRASWLRAAVSSLDYVAALQSPEDRRRYQDFERRLWRARATGPMWPHYEIFQYLVAARLLEEDWREGDGQFVLRIFEDPASTAEETRIGAYLAHRISPDGLKRLRAIADGESPKAEAARNALKEAAHRTKRDREEPNAPMFDERDGPFY